jgi:mutator protein MutT
MRTQVVVGAAIERGGALLAARRTGPEAAVGRWELPGGKVEDGETPDDALVREVREELGCEIVVTAWLDLEVPIATDLVLRVATARLVDGEPEPQEHDLVRWLAAGELDDVDWLDPDRPFLPRLRAELLRPRPRGVFDERDDAEQVAAQLRREGYDAWTERERFAGEDDDEDHAWAVLTDAPEVRLELLVEEHDGWYDAGEPGPPPSPFDLPSAPRR